MSARSFNTTSSRYGFNGKEKDDENNVNGGSYDFGARMYDSRIGRWSSTDSRISKYPNMSPYNFGMNDPVIFIDVDGNDVIVAFQGGPFGGGKTLTVDNKTSAYNIVKQAESDAMAKNIEFDGRVIQTGLTAGASVNNAYDFIKANYTAGEKLVIYGYSYGGDPAIELAEKLKADGITVDLLVTVDATDGPMRNSTVSSEIPDNVTTNINLYQTDNDGKSSSSHSASSSSDKTSSGSSDNSSGSSGSDSGSSDFPGSHGGPNTAKDASKTNVINRDLSGPNVNHGNISAVSQNPISKVINNILGTGQNKNPNKANTSSTPTPITPNKR
jgi:RHS repeat-associated protein